MTCFVCFQQQIYKLFNTNLSQSNLSKCQILIKKGFIIRRHFSPKTSLGVFDSRINNKRIINPTPIYKTYHSSCIAKFPYQTTFSKCSPKISTTISKQKIQTSSSKQQQNLTSPTGMELKEVVDRLESFASTSKLAAGWDNVGLLLEPSAPHTVRCLFLTNDLTERVLDEAVTRQTDAILSYHPPLFASFKRVTQSAWKQRIIVKCFENRIAVYSPHTAYDSVKGGVNDWLIGCFNGVVTPVTPTEEGSDTGEGRLCRLDNETTVDDVINTVKKHLGLNHLRVAHAVGSGAERKVSTIACCAGSGSGVLSGVCADVYLTGEMSHHSLLDATSDGATVILCEHSNTERGFLRTHVQTLTQLLENKVDVVVSELDRDPIEIV